MGATANPTIVHDVWKKDPARWGGRVRELAKERPTATEVELAWAIVEEMSTESAPLLMPAFERTAASRAGFRCRRTRPCGARPTEMLEQGIDFTTVAPNIIVKFPATRAGIAAMEEATYRGVSVNCTVSFSVSQAVAAAEAVERGLERRDREGLPTDDMGPVITIMVGRVEDWLRVLVDRDGIVVHPAALAYSGVAVFKQAYRIFQERGFRARLLAAAIRHQLHWSEFVGGDVVITLPSGVAEEVQRLGGARCASGWTTRSIPCTSTSSSGVSRLHEGVRAGRADGRRVRFVPADGADPARIHRLVPRAVWRPSQTRSCPTPTCGARAEMYVVVARWVAREGEEAAVERSAACQRRGITTRAWLPHVRVVQRSIAETADVPAVRAVRRRGRICGPPRLASISGRMFSTTPSTVSTIAQRRSTS